MAHASGIKVSKDLAAFIAQSKDQNGLVRAFEVKIDMQAEALELSWNSNPGGTWEADYALVHSRHEGPCYMFIRMDSKLLLQGGGFNWIFVAWVPDCASVQEKMIYSSTKGEMMKEFGSNLITYKIYWNNDAMPSLAELKQQIDLSGDITHSLTVEELEKQANVEIRYTSLQTRAKNFQGIDFQLHSCAVEALQRFSSQECNLLTLAIDTEQEEIRLKSEGGSDLSTVCDSGKDESLYALFRMPSTSLVFFVHFNGGYASSIKSRMLYSSCKAALLDRLKCDFNIEIGHKIETDDPADLTANALDRIINPPKEEKQTVFIKPKPAGRGPPRLIQ